MTEWYEILNYLFNLGYVWWDGTQRIFKNNNFFPDYILIEQVDDKNIDLKIYPTEICMISYSHIPYENSIIIKANQYLRKIKLERILNKN